MNCSMNTVNLGASSAIAEPSSSSLGVSSDMAVKPMSTPQVHLVLEPRVHKLLNLGAAYHGVSARMYAHWLLEIALNNEVRYYGWQLKDE